MRTSTPFCALRSRSWRIGSEGTKYALAIQIRFFAAAMRSCMSRSPLVTTPLSVEVTKAAAVSPARSSRGNESGGKSSVAASCQFSAKPCCIAATAGPRTSTLLSRHSSSDLPRPRHLSSTPKPPVIPTRPSTTTILRWVRARSSWPGTGRNFRTVQPASSSGADSFSEKLRLPTASTRMRQATPLRVRSAMAATSRRAVSLSDQTKVTMWMLFFALPISATAASNTLPLLTQRTSLPPSSRTPTVW